MQHELCTEAPDLDASTTHPEQLSNWFYVIKPTRPPPKVFLLLAYAASRSYQPTTRLDQEFKMNNTNQLTHKNTKGLPNTERRCQHFARGGGRKRAPLTV